MDDEEEEVQQCHVVPHKLEYRDYLDQDYSEDHDEQSHPFEGNHLN